MVVVAIAFIVPIFLHRFRIKMIPVVVAEIVVGLIIGKSGFNWIVADSTLELLSLLGLMYLMFLSGLEIDFRSFRKKSRTSQLKIHPIYIASFVFIGIFALSYGLSFGLLSLGLITEPFFMTLIIATISLGVVVPVLKENNMIETPLGQTILLVAVISDLVTMILLAVYISSLYDDAGRMWSLLLFFIIVIGTYVVLRFFATVKAFDVLRRGTVQIGTRAVFALLFLFVALSEVMHVEIILGAFLAGVVVSMLGPNKEFMHQLDSFGYGFLIPIFFVMVGVNLDLWSLLSDPSLLLLIPLLIGCIFMSKIIPSLIMRRWFSWRETFSSGVLLASTLSLVVAAATVAAEVGIIDGTMQDALILVAVLTCVVSPIIFNKLYVPKETPRSVIAIVGANYITMPVTQDLIREGDDVKVYSMNRTGQDDAAGYRDSVIEVAGMSVEELEEAGTFDADIVVLGTTEDHTNIQLAKHAKAIGIERIIVRVENPEKYEELHEEEEMTVFSTLYASRTLLKALIEHPSIVKLIAQDDTLQEIQMNNAVYHNTELRNFPYLEGVLVLRIYRGGAFVIPHGSTQIRVHDLLLVSGDLVQIQKLKENIA